MRRVILDTVAFVMGYCSFRRCTPRAVGLVAGFPSATATTSPRARTTFPLCLMTFSQAEGSCGVPGSSSRNPPAGSGGADPALIFLTPSGPTGSAVRNDTDEKS